MKPFLTHEPTNGTCFVTYCTQFLFSARLFSTLVPSVASLSPLREERISFPPKLVASNYYKGDIARSESLPLRGGRFMRFVNFQIRKNAREIFDEIRRIGEIIGSGSSISQLGDGGEVSSMKI